MNTVEDAKFSAPTDMFKFSVPEWAKLNRAGNNADLAPKGPVSADNLISASGQCPPAAEPTAPPAQAAAPKAAQTAQAAAPPPDRLEPAGLTPAGSSALQAPVMGGVTLGMTECGVARRLGTPSNVSISVGPKGQRRVVLTYAQGERPGLYSFQSGRLIQIDATLQQAKKYDRQVKKPARRARSRSTERMYVQ